MYNFNEENIIETMIETMKSLSKHYEKVLETKENKIKSLKQETRRLNTEIDILREEKKTSVKKKDKK